MTRIFITGSSDGIGLSTARNLISQGHQVVLHARSAERAAQTKEAAPGAENVVVANIDTIQGMKQLATEANKLGTFDTVVHNAGLGFQNPYNKTADGFAQVFAVNSLAYYVVTCLMHRPKRLVYMSSGLHHSGDSSLKDVTWSQRKWSGMQGYSDTKFHNVLLAFAMARHWKDVESYAVDPRWVKTKMGGAGAPGDVEEGAETLTWLASGAKAESGKLYQSMKPVRSHSDASDEKKQQEYLNICAQLSGVEVPGRS